MALTFSSLPDLLNHGFDTVIDVRSPAEFAEDHIPGAINLPVLDNEERARVGTIYKQQSPFLARKLGAALVFRNSAAHLEGPLAQKDGGWRPLVYCWRGGQRSGGFTWMLGQVGWRAEVIEGGYRSYRRLVHAALYDTPLPLRPVLLDGNTGTAKTALLPLLRARGVQVLDLEGLANHRGSLLGAMGPQPDQKAFETALAAQICALDPASPVLVEAESNKIGQRIIPPTLWEAMRRAPRIEVSAPLAARARFLAQGYADMTADPDRLRDRLSPLRSLRGAETVDHWLALLAEGRMEALAQALMVDHYDPAYAKSRERLSDVPLARCHAETLDADGLQRLADEIAAHLAQLS